MALRQLNETLEEEIKRIAYAVHDEAGQLLVAVHLALAEVRENCPNLKKNRSDGLKNCSTKLKSNCDGILMNFGRRCWMTLAGFRRFAFLAEGVSKRANLPIQIKTTVTGRLPGRR